MLGFAYVVLPVLGGFLKTSCRIVDMFHMCPIFLICDTTVSPMGFS